jgi:hypothetical protein
MSIYLRPMDYIFDDFELQLPSADEILIAGIRRTIPVALSMFHAYTEILKCYHSFDTQVAPVSIPQVIGRTYTLIGEIVIFTGVVFTICDNIGRKFNEPVVGQNER